MSTIEVTTTEKITHSITYDEFLEEIKNLTEEEADRFFDVCQEVVDRRARRGKALVRCSDTLYEIAMDISVVISILEHLPHTNEGGGAEYPLNDEERAYAYHNCIDALDDLRNGLKAVIACERAYVNGDDEALEDFIKLTSREEEEEDEDLDKLTGEDLGDVEDDPEVPDYCDPLAV